MSTDGDSLPIDGRFGRLLGSRTVTSVSAPTLTWDKESASGRSLFLWALVHQ